MRAAILALLSGLIASPVAAQTPSADFVSSMRSAVGLVVAQQCSDGNDRSGTAFVWPQADQVVTARHVVAGCSRITVQFRDYGSFNAAPLREIRAQDIIALRLDRPVGASVQTVTDRFPAVHSKIAAVGFALGAPTADDKLLTVTTGNTPPPARLSHLLPENERQQIQRSGPWDLDTAIIRLDGNLTHGHSGAPLFDADGRVVAVGAGGLQSGASGIVWAVSARYLMDDRNWSAITAGATVAQESGLAFSVQPPQAQIDQVNCGTFSLSKSRTSSFAEISAVADDPVGLQKVLAFVGAIGGIDFNSMSFDVWEDLRSGAVVPLPAGARPQRDQSQCYADVGQGVAIFIRALDNSAQPNNPAPIVQYSAQLENDAGFAIGPNAWDPDFFYQYPITRPDGFYANRRGAAGPEMMYDTTRGFQNYAFVTHVARSGHYLGVVALRRQALIDFAAGNTCRMTGDPNVCSIAIAPYWNWAIAALSVHMSTMPPI